MPKEEGSFFEQVQQNPEGHVPQADLAVEGDPFAGAGAEAVANIAAADAEAADAAKVSGQEPGSPSGKEGDETTGVAVKGQEAPVSPAGEKKGEEASAPDTSTGKPEEGKPLPFDQDPKWLAARAAEKALNDMSEKHGISVEEIGDMLEAGIKLKDIIGDQDAEAIVEKAQKMDKTEQWWAEQEALQREQEESPENTIIRLKQEKADLKARTEKSEARRDEIARNQQAIRSFEDTVDKAVDTSTLSAKEKAMARNILGVDNPIDSVDIGDKGKVKSSVQQGVENFESFLAEVKQAAIDEFAAGKSEITPVPGQKVPTQTPHVDKRVTNPNASVEETFADGNRELIERLNKMAAEGID